MLTFGIVCALIATASAGYASSSSGAGLYNTNTYGQTYGSKYPYSNSFVGGYAGAGFPIAPFPSPYDFQQQFQQYYDSLSASIAKQRQLTTTYADEGSAVSAYATLSPSKPRYENEMLKNLYAQQLAYQAALQNSINANIAAIRNQALYGSGYGYGGSSAGTGAYASGSSGAYSGNSGVTGSYGGVRPGGSTYGGTIGGPNYAAAGGSVGNGYQHQHAGVYPSNPARPNLDSRFSDDSAPGVTITRGPGGFVGVSSFSSSSDVNGVRNREAGTSVNNNGKVTTYYTRN